MPEYSTGGRGGESGGATCELCGEPADNLTEATVAGARLTVCASCAPHDDTPRTERGSETQPSTDRTGAPSDEADPGGRTGPQTERPADPSRGSSPLWDSDTSHWEEGGVSYDTDRLPYLVSEYGDRVQTAREAAGLTREELAADLDISEQELLAVEQGNAATAGIGGSTITALEDYLDVTLTE